MARIDDDEIEVFCRQCNGYLYSIGPAEAESRPWIDSQLVECPMKKGPLGECTGVPRHD
jgi:hypothetical protein